MNTIEFTALNGQIMVKVSLKVAPAKSGLYNSTTVKDHYTVIADHLYDLLREHNFHAAQIWRKK